MHSSVCEIEKLSQLFLPSPAYVEVMCMQDAGVPARAVVVQQNGVTLAFFVAGNLVM